MGTSVHRAGLARSPENPEPYLPGGVGSGTLPGTPAPTTRARYIRRDVRAPTMKNDFKGNKQSLPSKRCAVCGRPMTWRKAWAKNWDSVLYCSDACRANKTTKKPHA